MSDTPDRMPPAAHAALEAILARTDPGIVGVVLSGSAARGMTTEHSDVDVYVVLADGVRRGPVLRSRAIDEIPIPLASLECVDPYGTDGWWQRWSFAWAQVLRDDADGRVTAAVRRQATLTPDEQEGVLTARLDGAINLLYRALKSDRDGRALEARLDAAEALPWLLDVVFALAGRVRPYNKYLPWELREHPLPVDAWRADRLLSALDRLLAGEADAIRAAFTTLERECRAFDAARAQTTLGRVIDDWGEELALLRGSPPGLSGAPVRPASRCSRTRTPRPARARRSAAPRWRGW